MRDEYDFSKARKNPYSTQLKKSITIRLDEDSVDYFKAISEEVGIPYQTLINLYLRDCATSHRKLNLNWKWFRAVSDIFSPVCSRPGHQDTKTTRGWFFIPRFEFCKKWFLPVRQPWSSSVRLRGNHKTQGRSKTEVIAWAVWKWIESN